MRVLAGNSILLDTTEVCTPAVRNIVKYNIMSFIYTVSF